MTVTVANDTVTYGGENSEKMTAQGVVILGGASTSSATSTPLAGTTSISEVLGPFTPQLGRPINLRLSGTWTGTLTVKRSIDGGATKDGLTVGGTPWGVFTANCNEPVWEETEVGATFYLDFTKSSGTLSYRLAQ